MDDSNYEDYDDNEDQNASDDTSYDVELEKDIGDPDDIAELEHIRRLEEEERRIHYYEIMADAAALKGDDVVTPNDPSTSVAIIDNPNHSKCTRKGSGKGRGATKGLRVSESMQLEFDNYGRATGKWQIKYGQQVGLCMRKLNINWNWKDVSTGLRNLLWEDTRNLFHIPDEKRFKDKFLSSVAKRFRDFKSKLVSGWITCTRKRTKVEDGLEPYQIWPHVKEEDWRLFKHIKNLSPAKRKREKAIESAKKNEHHHHLGQKNFNSARPIWIKDGFYPSSVESSSISVDGNRADDWFCSMHFKDKETGDYMINKPKTKEVAKKFLEVREKQTKGDFIPEGNKDALFYALGEKEDHPSRPRGFGGINVTLKNAFGSSKLNHGRSRESRTSLEDREALKNELREEIKADMKLEVQNTVSSIIKEIGLSTFKELNDVIDVGKEIHSHQAENNNLQLSLLQQKVKNDTPCRLFLKDTERGVLYEVARGKTFPGEVSHQGQVKSDQLRVKVLTVPPEFNDLPLPIPVSAYDIYQLRDAVGSMVLWPIALVRLEYEEKQNGMQPEVLGSNSHHSRLSVTPTKAPSKEIMVDSLTPDCQWLNTLVSTTLVGEVYDIYFDADLFYYKEDGKTEVFKDDLKKFLTGLELSTSVIQIFIRALQEDLVKVDGGVRIGWLCPNATSDTKLLKNVEVAISYVTNSFKKSALNGDRFILAPITNSQHWVLLAICPQAYTIYEFDSVTLKGGRKLFMKMVVLSALKRYKMSGGEIKSGRKEPLWKSMKCPQRSGCIENGEFVMRFMYDIVKGCRVASDLEKVWNFGEEESKAYTNEEITEVKDKWATYFTSHCVA